MVRYGLERFQAANMDKCTLEIPIPESFTGQFHFQSRDGIQRITTSIAYGFLPTHPAVVKDPNITSG